MKPIKFDGYNCVYSKDQEEYLELPAYKHGDEFGSVSSCWGLTVLERLKILFTGKIFVTILSFNKALTPQRLQVESPVPENPITIITLPKKE